MHFRTNARLRIVTVAFNPGAELARMAQSLLSACSIPFHLVIVDNGTDPHRVDDVARDFGAQVVRPGGNLGYGRAANLGAAKSSEEWLLVVNPDVIFGEGSIDALMRATDDWPRAGAFGPLIRTPEGDIYPSARQFPRLSSGIGHALLAGVWPSNPFTRAYHRNCALDRAHVVDWLSGACLLLRSPVFEEIGGFDDSYFMFFEDTQLGEQLVRAGWVSVFVPESQITHDQGKSWRDQPEAMIRAHHRSAAHYLSTVYSSWFQWPLRQFLVIALRIRELIQVHISKRFRK